MSDLELPDIIEEDKKPKEKDIKTIFFDLLGKSYKWVHFRYDCSITPEPILEWLKSDFYLYSVETEAKGHSKDHVHVVASYSTSHTTNTLNNRLVKLIGKDVNRSTSGVRTSFIRALTYICKNFELMKYKGLPNDMVMAMRRHSFEKYNKAAFMASRFEVEHRFYSGEFDFEQFAVKVWLIYDKYLLDLADHNFKAYLRKHYLHNNKDIGKDRARYLADQVRQEVNFW